MVLLEENFLQALQDNVIRHYMGLEKHYNFVLLWFYAFLKCGLKQFISKYAELLSLASVFQD